MATKKDSIIFYKSFYEVIKELPAENQLEVYNAIFTKYFCGNEIKLSGISKGIFNLVKPNIDSANKRYFASVENGKKGGRPSGKNKSKPNINLNKTYHKPSTNLNDNDNDNVNDNDNKYIYFQNQDLENIFIEFLTIRKKLKAVNSGRAIKMLLNKLSKFDDQTKYAMIEQSIVHSWKDIYELKEVKQANVPAWLNEERKEKELTDEQKRILAELKGNDPKS